MDVALQGREVATHSPRRPQPGDRWRPIRPPGQVLDRGEADALGLGAGLQALATVPHRHGLRPPRAAGLGRGVGPVPEVLAPLQGELEPHARLMATSA